MYGYYYKKGKMWKDSKLWEATKNNPQEDINIESFLNQDNYWNIGSFKELAKEMQLVLKADYSYPIILNEEHRLVDGAHRLVHAYLDGKTNIKGVIIRNDQWPEPDYDEVRICQNKQKPIIEVEPKFKVGDWVVSKFGDSWHIDSFDKKNYQVSNGKGNYNYFPISKQDEMHLWTIQDAKDGDILACRNGWTCIFKRLNDNIFSSHCFMDSGGWFCENGGQAHVLDNSINCHPATKEQRKLLFTKLKESGHEWDADKKELKKIEQKPVEETSCDRCKNAQPSHSCQDITELGRCYLEHEKQGEQKPNYCHHEVDLSECSEEYRKAYYDGWNNCNMQHSQCKSELNDVVKCLINGMKFYYEDNEEATWGTDKWSMPVKHIIEVLEKQVEKKPAEWSEEDELHIRELESLVKQVWAIAEHENDKDTIHKMSDLSFFLKTLKPQQKQEWSEDDELMLKDTIKFIESGWSDNGKSHLIYWLKSIKDRIK